MRSFAALVLLLASGTTGNAKAQVRSSLGCGEVPPVPPGGSQTITMTSGELDREFVLHLPESYKAKAAVPLVLDFHGYGGTGASEETYTDLSRHADEQGYIVVYPQSTAFDTEDGQRIASWNDLAGSVGIGAAGPICSETADTYAHPPECGEPKQCVWASCHDDVGFVEAMLDRLEATLCVDLDRIYATGMSNGGMFVHRLGCDLADRFAAIAPVGGTLARGFNCAPGSALSMINIYGTRDDYVSQKGVVSSDGFYYEAALDVLAKWASEDSQNCRPSPTPYETPVTRAFGFDCVKHEECATGAEVVHCGWDGAHEWPTHGDTDSGNQLIWEFFTRHSRSAEAGG